MDDLSFFKRLIHQCLRSREEVYEEEPGSGISAKKGGESRRDELVIRSIYNDDKPLLVAG